MTGIKKVLLIIFTVFMVLTILLGMASRYIVNAVETDAETGLNLECKSAVLIDYNTGKCVYQKNELEHLPIASMVKIMTLNIAFDELNSGNLSLEDSVTASENATSMGGSQAFLDTHSQYKVNELIKSIIVASANDSCVAMAEHISGSVDGFVMRMNEKAAQLGMENTNFVNCTGLPTPGQYSCAEDVGKMMRSLIDHDEFFDYSRTWMFDFEHPSGRVTGLTNTNKLIRGYEGCDGGKTGFTNEAMFCLSATAKRGNTRLISVVMGAPTSKVRNAQNAKLFNYGFANYETKMVVMKDNMKELASVEKGKIDAIEVTPRGDFYHFAKKGSDEITFEKTVNELVAPVESGEIVGNLKIFAGSELIGEVDYVANESVEEKVYLDFIDDFTSDWIA